MLSSAVKAAGQDNGRVWGPTRQELTAGGFVAAAASHQSELSHVVSPRVRPASSGSSEKIAIRYASSEANSTLWSGVKIARALPPTLLTEPAAMETLKSSTLQLRQLTKRYSNFEAVSNLDLNVPSGSLLTLLGPSGCGKSTVLRMVAGFLNVTSGEILVDGKDISRVEPNFRDIGMVFQNYALFPHMTVESNIAFGLKMRGVSKDEQAERVRDVLEMVQLTHLADRYPSQLSGGQQQRVALARAVVIKPKLLLLDEPLGALDRHLREGLQAELRDLQRKLGITSILVTHDQDEALYLSDYIAVMNGGCIEQLDTPIALYDRPQTEFVARFLGVPNIFTTKIVRKTASEVVVSLGGQQVIVPTTEGKSEGAECKISIRPSHIELVRQDDARMGVVTTIKTAHELGERIVYHCEVGDLKIEANAPRTSGSERFAVGETVKLLLDPAHTILLRD
jgi:spermidine/putrescine ABC transporter ATP-binding subunit